MTQLSGQLDDIAMIQRRTVMRDSLGGEVVTWVDFAPVWMQLRPTGVREQYLNDANREQATRNAVMRIRWRDDLDETMRVVHRAVVYDILGVEDVERMRDINLTLEARL